MLKRTLTAAAATGILATGAAPAVMAMTAAAPAVVQVADSGGTSTPDMHYWG